MDDPLSHTIGEKVAKVSVLTLSLMVSAVALAGACVLLHDWAHEAACSLRFVTMGLGSLALLRLGNSVIVFFPKLVAKAIHWIHAISFELLTFLMILLLRIYSIFASFEKPIGNGRAPILLVHGYINSASVWFYLRKKLARAGLGPIYTISLGRPFASIREHAKKLALKVEQIKKETGRSEIYLVGHSMGGIVSSYYAVHLAPEKTVSKLITIASPLHGTWMAKIAPGTNGREMERNSPFLLELCQKLSGLKDFPIYNIGTKTDLLVVPSSSSLLPIDPNRQFVFEDIGHASLLFSPRVADLLRHFLSE